MASFLEGRSRGRSPFGCDYDEGIDLIKMMACGRFEYNMRKKTNPRCDGL